MLCTFHTAGSNADISRVRSGHKEHKEHKEHMVVTGMRS
jgi:hypothetical protein